MTNYNTRASVVETSMFRQYSTQSLILQNLTSSLSNDLSLPDNIVSRQMTDDELDVARLLIGDQSIPCAYGNISGVEFTAYRLLSLQSWNSNSYHMVRGHEDFPGELLNLSGTVISKEEAKNLRSSLTSLHQKRGHTWAKADDFKIGTFQRFSDLSIGGVTYQSGTSARLSHVIFNSQSSKSGQVPALVLSYCCVEVDMDTGEHKKEHDELGDFDDMKSAEEDCPWVAGYKRRKFTFARVDWFPPAPVSRDRKHFEKWNVHKQMQPKFSFIPVQRIVSGFVPLLGSSTTSFSCGPLRGHLVF
jgi:hypothetical protein